MSGRFSNQPRLKRRSPPLLSGRRGAVADDVSAIGSRLARAKRRRMAKEVTRQSRWSPILPPPAIGGYEIGYSGGCGSVRAGMGETPVRDLAIKVNLHHV